MSLGAAHLIQPLARASHVGATLARLAIVITGLVALASPALAQSRSTPGQTPPPALQHATAEHGTVTSFWLRSPVAPDSQHVRVYLPPSYSADRRYPAIYALIGDLYFDRIALPARLDSAIAAGAPPVIAVALPAPDAWDATRPDTPEGAAFVRFIADSIVLEVERRFAASPRRADRWLLGFSGGANVMIDLAVRNPTRFARVAAQSPGWMFRDPATLQKIDQVFIDGAVRNVERAATKQLPAFWFTWGDAVSEWESRSRVHGARMMRALRARGAGVEQGALVPGDHGLQLLEQSLRDALTFLWASAGRDSSR